VSGDYFILALIAMAALAAFLAGYAQSKDDDFDLRDLVRDSRSGRVSLFKVGQLVALASSTWLLIYEALHGRMTDWMFTGYMVSWAGANIANKLTEQKKEGS